MEAGRRSRATGGGEELKIHEEEEEQDRKRHLVKTDLCS